METTFAAFLFLIVFVNIASGVQLTCYKCDDENKGILQQLGVARLDYFTENPNCASAANLTTTIVNEVYKEMDQFCYVITTYYKGTPFTVSRGGNTRDNVNSLKAAVEKNVMTYPLDAPSVGCTRKLYCLNGYQNLIMEVCVCYSDKCNGEPLKIGMPMPPPSDPSGHVPPMLSCLSCLYDNIPNRAAVSDKNCQPMSNFLDIPRVNDSAVSSCITAGVFVGDKLIAINRFPTSVPLPADTDGKCLQQSVGSVQYNVVYCSCSSNDCNSNFIDGCKCGKKYGESSSSSRETALRSLLSVPLLFLLNLALN